MYTVQHKLRKGPWFGFEKLFFCQKTHWAVTLFSGFNLSIRREMWVRSFDSLQNVYSVGQFKRVWGPFWGFFGPNQEGLRSNCSPLWGSWAFSGGSETYFRGFSAFSGGVWAYSGGSRAHYGGFRAYCSIQEGPRSFFERFGPNQAGLMPILGVFGPIQERAMLILGLFRQV